MYKVMVSRSPFLTATDEYGPYRFKWYAWLVAWYIVTLVNDCAEATILKRVQ